ncbi:hypothetical protein C815_00591 [Firmicutes bacterium M10-2]|nr:hypothetical protein C815_00591 [Firmicutes bacterium M10-2]
MFNIILIEDDPNDLENLKTILSDFLNARGLAYTCQVYNNFYMDPSIFEKTDLVFLNVKDDNTNEIEFGRALNRQFPKITIVITSNHSQNLIDGYTIRAARYFLKPIDPDLFEFEMDDVFGDFALSQRQGIMDQRLAPCKVLFSEIMYIEYQDHKTIVVLKDGLFLKTVIPFKEWISLLEEQSFARPYPCFIVNLRFVESIGPKDIILRNKRKIPLSKDFKQDFIASYKQIKQK